MISNTAALASDYANAALYAHRAARASADADAATAAADAYADAATAAAAYYADRCKRYLQQLRTR